jgi:large subunit ribosomal protein L33
MARKGAKSIVIRLMSMAGTGFFYTTKKAIKANAEKLQLIKFDPRVNARVLFKEEVIKKKKK